MIKILKIFVETDVPSIHLLNDSGFKVGQGRIGGEEVFMMEVRTGKEETKEEIKKARS